ncbi:hypothetical protein [Thiomonas sp. FB-Cd]|uniref:hypothetical protein n=1 Tax=Thiomonas sp. FB-Cd TaxID=1158292 RepID=UPI0004DF9EDF|nr:hypothetical protein [Thiomonas sp. FB-Cd]
MSRSANADRRLDRKPEDVPTWLVFGNFASAASRALAFAPAFPPAVRSKNALQARIGPGWRELLWRLWYAGHWSRPKAARASPAE